MKHFYLKKNDNIEGPYDRGELVYLLSQGELHPEAKIREGEQEKKKKKKKKLGISRQRKKASPSSSPKTQQEITGLKRRPVSEVEAKSTPPHPSAPPYQETPRPEGSSTVAPPTFQKFHRKKQLLIAAIILLILILLFCLLYWLFSSSQPGSGQAGGGQGGQSAQGDQNSSTNSESSGPEQGTSQEDVPPQAATAPKPAQSSKSSAGRTSQPPEPEQGSMKSPEPPPSKSLGTARFFGIEAEGPVFVYVVDCSGSMSGSRIELTRQELKKSINQLNLNQSFYVIFFSNVDYPMFFPSKAAQRPLPATDENVKQLEQWVDGFQISGGTDPRSALMRALSLAPDSIFLMTDGTFDSGIADLLKSQNTGKVAVHTIAFQSRSGENLLKRIAKENSGQHRFVP
ncbi:MAG: VWA domain-containing protein [Planctomycetaceae bacterium]|nr:VWA domain-containing protein [Planctomycetaceae bacterium]